LKKDFQAESVVYGCIKHITASDGLEHKHSNRRALLGLPSVESWSLVNREMFALPELDCSNIETSTQVMHFGASYQGVEYEWKYWLEQFENLLRKMYWVSATVHLETELSGLHSFLFETCGNLHVPHQSEFNVRCEWARDSG
jgi:hypothetical protein